MDKKQKDLLKSIQKDVMSAASMLQDILDNPNSAPLDDIYMDLDSDINKAMQKIDNLGDTIDW